MGNDANEGPRERADLKSAYLTSEGIEDDTYGQAARTYEEIKHVVEASGVPIMTATQQSTETQVEEITRNPLKFDVEYYEYDCWKPCTPNGCMGHITDVPVTIWIDDVAFCVMGSEGGDFPGGEDKDGIKRVQRAVEHLTNTLALAAVSGGDFCAEARAEGRGPCGACSWCVKQAQERAEKAERELAKMLVKDFGSIRPCKTCSCLVTGGLEECHACRRLREGWEKIESPPDPIDRINEVIESLAKDD